MNHMFDVDVAKHVGIVAAVLFQNIVFWCQHSQANSVNFFDGRFWTYNSVKALLELFPYLSKSQIDTAIKKLIDSGMIVKGNYNKSTYDRTAWYAVTDFGYAFLKNRKSISEISEMEEQEIGNGFTENRKPIPDINTDINSDINSDISFARFWKAYPRKVAKPQAQKAWKALKPSDDVVEMILADINRRIGVEWKKKDMQYIPHPSTYLNQRRWEDESEDTDAECTGCVEEIEITPEQQRIIDEINARGENFG